MTQSTPSIRNIAFIGAGNMTRSIVTGMCQQAYPADHIMASNPSPEKLQALHNSLGILTTSSNYEAVNFAQVIVLSVKPQLMQTVCADVSEHCDLSDKLIISIAAGITTARLVEMLAGHQNIVRCMPNTPSAIGMGMSGLFANAAVSDSDREFSRYIMSQVGKTLWVDNESAINTVIAGAGSSPAYVFLFAQAMQEEVERMGLSTDDARTLVQQAIIGSAHMMESNSDLSLAELRNQVTSKGGTTHEAVQSLLADNLPDIVAKAMRAAVARAEQMSSQF